MTLNCFADSNNNLSRAIEQKEAERNKKIHEFKIRVKEMIEKDNSKERELIEFSENLDELKNKQLNGKKFKEEYEKLINKYSDYVLRLEPITVSENGEIIDLNNIATSSIPDGTINYYEDVHTTYTTWKNHTTSKLEYWIASVFELVTGFMHEVMPFFYAVIGPLSENEFQEIGSSSISSREFRTITHKFYDAYDSSYSNWFTCVITEGSVNDLNSDIAFTINGTHDNSNDWYNGYREMKSRYYDDYDFVFH